MDRGIKHSQSHKEHYRVLLLILPAKQVSLFAYFLLKMALNCGQNIAVSCDCDGFLLRKCPGYRRNLYVVMKEYNLLKLYTYIAASLTADKKRHRTLIPICNICKCSSVSSAVDHKLRHQVVILHRK